MPKKKPRRVDPSSTEWERLAYGPAEGYANLLIGDLDPTLAQAALDHYRARLVLLRADDQAAEAIVVRDQAKAEVDRLLDDLEDAEARHG